MSTTKADRLRFAVENHKAWEANGMPTWVPAYNTLHKVLTIFIETGKTTSGTIAFPELRTVIQYHFNGNSLVRSYVRVKNPNN